MLKLPHQLGEDVRGKPRLFSLFQPARSTRRLFELFVGALGGKPGADSVSTRAAKSALRAYRLQAAIGAAIGALIAIDAAEIVALIATIWFHASGLGWAFVVEAVLAALCAAVISAVAFIGCVIWHDLRVGFVHNNFGLCTGYRSDATPPGEDSLIEWLHLGIQGAAGKPLDRPLTFKDLWDAPGGPFTRLDAPARQTKATRSIDLRMITTNLTHGRPYDLPLGDETSRIFYKEEDLRPYFPEAVLRHLRDHSRGYVPMVPGVDPEPANVPEDLRELPAGDLPIIVATRLSLSFPTLFSAVPLWAIDYEAPYNCRTLRRCWFSDGGICSNFPIHLFDATLPRWPTFGISLGPRSVYWPNGNTWLPKFHNQGRGDRWDRFGDETSVITGEPVEPGERLAGFVNSIISTAKDWNDNTSMRMPGVRDRVVRVNLLPTDGGLNLKLTAQQILRFAQHYGRPAGEDLVRKFIAPATVDAPSKYWSEHRWVRFNSLLVALRERVEALRAAAEQARYAAPLSAQIAASVSAPPLSEKNMAEERTLSGEQAQELERLLSALEKLELEFAHADLPQPYTPLPTPVLRIRPPL